MAERINDVLGELLAQQAAEDAQAGQQQTAPQPEIPPQSGENIATQNQPSTVAQDRPTAEPTTTQPEEANAQAQAADPQAAAQIGLDRAAQALSQAQAQNEQLAAQLKELLAQRQQQSTQAQTAIEETMTQQPPLDIDLSDLAYLSDEERAQKMQQLRVSIEEQTRKSIMDEIAPVMEDFKNRQHSAEDEAVRTTLSGQPQFKGFRENESTINNIIENTPELAQLEPERRYTLAYLISRGVSSMNTDAKPKSAEEMANEAAGNPEVMKLLEKRRAQDIAQTNSEVPTLSASGGGSYVPANVDRAPQTLKEAREQALKALGI